MCFLTCTTDTRAAARADKQDLFIHKKAPQNQSWGAFLRFICIAYSAMRVTLNSVRRLRWCSSSVVALRTTGWVSP
jgi:hypothetical protein